MNLRVIVRSVAMVLLIWRVGLVAAQADILLHDDFGPPYRPTILAPQEGWHAPAPDENHSIVLDASANPEFNFPTKGRAVRIGANQATSWVQKSFGRAANPERTLTVRAVMAFNGDKSRSYLSLHRDEDEAGGMLFGVDHEAKRFCYQEDGVWKTFDEQPVFLGNGQLFYLFEATIQPERGTWALRIKTTEGQALVEAEELRIPAGSWDPPPDTVSLRAGNNRIFLDSITITQ